MLSLEQIIGKVIESEFGLEGEGVSSEIVGDLQRIASRLFEVNLLKGNVLLMTVYVKVLHGDCKSKSYYRNQELIKNEFDILQKTYNETCGMRNISVVEPLAVYPDSLSLVTRSAGNDNVLDLFKSSISCWGCEDDFDRSKKIAANCGYFLEVMQENNFVEYENVDREKLIKKNQDELEVIFKKKGMFYNKVKKSIDFFMKQYLPKVGDSLILSRFHGDYTPQNIIVQGENIFVLDFCDSGIGSVYFDMARFYQVLDYYTDDPRFSAKKINDLIVEFLGCFDSLDSVLLTVFRIEILLQGIKERLRLRDEYKDRNFVDRLLNSWYVRKRINKLCLVCRGQDYLSLI